MNLIINDRMMRGQDGYWFSYSFSQVNGRVLCVSYFDHEPRFTRPYFKFFDMPKVQHD